MRSSNFDWTSNMAIPAPVMLANPSRRDRHLQGHGKGGEEVGAIDPK